MKSQEELEYCVRIFRAANFFQRGKVFAYWQQNPQPKPSPYPNDARKSICEAVPTKVLEQFLL